MLKRNNKFLAIGLAAVGAIGAASVAFATWVVGVQKTTENVKLNLLVDDVKDVNVLLTAKLTNPAQLKVQESQAYDNGNTSMVGAEFSAVDANAMKFGFSELKIKFGADVTKTLESVTITCETTLTTDCTANNHIQVKATNNDSPLTDKRTTGLNSMSYIAFETITLSKEAFTLNSGTGEKTYTFNSNHADAQKLKFNWGTFFEGKSPVNYYNDIYCTPGTGNWTGFDAKYTNQDIETQHTHVINELKGMKTYLEGLTDGITLKVTANLGNGAAA